jgi:hypothetical protein
MACRPAKLPPRSSHLQATVCRRCWGWDLATPLSRLAGRVNDPCARGENGTSLRARFLNSARSSAGSGTRRTRPVLMWWTRLPRAWRVTPRSGQMPRVPPLAACPRLAVGSSSLPSQANQSKARASLASSLSTPFPISCSTSATGPTLFMSAFAPSSSRSDTLPLTARIHNRTLFNIVDSSGNRPTAHATRCFRTGTTLPPARSRG